MIHETKYSRQLALLPLLTFLLLYMGIGTYLSITGQKDAFYQFPAASCALVGFAVALLMGYKNINEQIKIFTSGIADETIVLMCLIFMLAGAFSVLTQATGGVDATVNMGLYFLPERFLLPGLFLIACFVSMAMGTSMGTVSTVIPIAVGIALKSGLDLPLTIGAVVGGAMFGDNLSIISDTTIAATSSQGCDMRSKMLENLKTAIPAALLTVILLLFFSKTSTLVQDFDFDFIKTLPYLIVLALALSGMHVILVLMIGIAAAAIIGVSTSAVNFLQLGQSIYAGFLSMAEVFFLTFIAAGLAAIAIKRGGLQYLLDKLHGFLKGKRSAEAGIAILVSLADLCIANNTVAIIVTGGIAKQISERFGIAAARTASFLDTFSCVWQGLIPYGAQLLLAGALSKLSPFQIMPMVWYPMILGIIAIIAILIGSKWNQN